MRVGILSGSRGWHTEELGRALEARDVEPVRLPVQALVGRLGAESASDAGGETRVLAAGAGGPAADRGGDAGERGMSAAGEALEGLDGILVRTIPRGSLDQVIFRVDALHRLARLGIPVVNPAVAIERTVDKFYTSSLLAEAGIPTPPTVVAERMEDAMEAFRAFGDVILKPLFGSNGRGMVRLQDEEVAYRVFRALELERAVYYVQKTVPHPGRDVRAFVVGGRVVAAAARRAPGWRTNVARGGAVEALELPDEWAALAARTAALVGAEYAGVDLLPASSGEVYVLEVNGIPGWRGLQSVAAVDIAGVVVGHLVGRMRERRR